jgi:hypothetical protein
MKMDIDRHGPRPMPNSCKNLNPPNFSLPSTFNYKICRLSNKLFAGVLKALRAHVAKITLAGGRPT